MRLFEKHQNPLLIDTFPEGDGEDYGRYRLIAEIFPHENGGIVFFEAGWCFNDSSFPIHVIEGKIIELKKYNMEWMVGGHLIRELFDDGSDEKYWTQWEGWQHALKTPHGKKMVNNREFIHELAREHGAIV